MSTEKEKIIEVLEYEKVPHGFKVGKLFGFDLYINVPPEYGDRKRLDIIENSRKWLEKAFKNSDFMETLKDLFQG